MVKSNKNRNIPSGTRDILFGEAKVYRRITNTLTELYERNGFSEIVTPGIEYYDVFKTGSTLPQEQMYKLSDLDGRLIVLRADNTTPIARVAASRLGEGDSLAKFFYHQRVYRQMGGHTGRRSEIFQSGIEMVGSSGIQSDLLCMIYALKTLESFGGDYKLELGHVGYYNALVGELALDETELKLIRRLVEAKDTNKITTSEKIKQIPFLFGGEEVFGRAERLADGNANALEALAYLRKLYDALCAAGYKDKIMIDLGIVHTLDYYTGAVFRGYMEGAGETVLAGGRYDRLISRFRRDIPATGFGVNVSVVADTLIKAGKGDEYSREYNGAVTELVTFEDGGLREALAYCEGHPERMISPLGDKEENMRYARNRGISVVVYFDGMNGGARLEL